MMMRKLAILVAGLGAMIATPALAAGCDGPRTGFDNVYCFAKVYIELDKQLNANYSALMKKLAPASQATLRSGQLRWIRARDGQCYSAADGKKSVNMDCAISTTRERVQFLSDRAAECTAHGCIGRRLAE